MGTTSQKLTYLNTTKQLLKTEINKINNVLTDNSTFRSYPQELFNGYLDILNNGTDTLWNNLEKVSATGEEATLENVETAPMKMVLNGNTSQETTSGKNLFDKDNEQKIVINPTTGTERYGIIIEAPNKKVSFSGTWLSDNNLAYKLINSETYGSYVSFNSPITIDVQDKILFYNGTENQKLSAIVDKIQIEIGTITSYEPYTGGQPSPSPDYPQEVKVVTGENVVSVSGKNLLNVPNTFSVTTSANITASLNAGTYTISLEDYETNVEVGSSFLFQFLKDNTLVTDAYLTMSYKKITKAIPSEVDKIKIYASSSYNNSNGKTTTFKNLMIELGSTPTPYVPYSKTDYPISLGTLELCKIGNYQDYLYKNNGKWYVHKEIGKYINTNTSAIYSISTQYTNVEYVGISKPDDMFGKGSYQVVDVISDKTSVDKVSSIDSTDMIGKMKVSANQNAFWIGFAKGTGIETERQKLSGIVIYYPLATPTEEEITNTTLIEQLEAISKAKSVKDKTYITQTNDELPFILDVEAIKEYEVN